MPSVVSYRNSLRVDRIQSRDPLLSARITRARRRYVHAYMFENPWFFLCTRLVLYTHMCTPACNIVHVCVPACNLFLCLDQQDADSSVSSLHHSTLDEVSSQSLTQVLYIRVCLVVPVASYDVLILCTFLSHLSPLLHFSSPTLSCLSTLQSSSSDDSLVVINTSPYPNPAPSPPSSSSSHPPSQTTSAPIVTSSDVGSQQTASMATVSSTSSSVPMASLEAESGAEEEGEEEEGSMVVEEPPQLRQQSSPDSSKVCVCVCCRTFAVSVFAVFSSAGQWNQ